MSFLLHKTLTLTLPFSLPHFLPAAGTTRAMATQRIFQQKLNPLTGNSEWIIIEETDSEADPFPGMRKKALLANTSYLDMLNDAPRNRAFHEAIRKTVTKPCHVLDIGAGTGLLSMMAAKAMDSVESSASTVGTVTACESYLPMMKLTRKVLRLNGMESKIKVINKRSDELKVGVDITSRAEVLVSEILDSELLGEGLIPTLQHAHDMLLVENAQTVPYRATTYGQLVESPFLWKLHDLYNTEALVSDGIHLVPTGSDTPLSIKRQQFPMHCDALKEELKLLSEPFKIFEFDFWKRPESHGERDIFIRTTRDGRIHGVVSWWTLQLDSEGKIFYSTAPKWINYSSSGQELETDPGLEDWCDHWKQCVWFIPGKGLSVTKGEEVHLHAVHGETSISYSLQSRKKETKNSSSHDGGCQLILSPERIAIYGDANWRHSMAAAVQKVFQARDPYLCVVADDSVFLTILVAHMSRTSDIISLFPGLLEKGGQYLQSVASANGFSMDQITVIRKKGSLTLNDTHQREIDLLIGEPFYYGNDGALPWQNLRFWKERSNLDFLLSNKAVIMPCKGLLRACAMSLHDLWSSRHSLHKVEGFDHSTVNSTLGACGGIPSSAENPCLPFPIWQCGRTEELSGSFTVMEFDFCKPISPCSGETKVEFTKPGICHGFVLWIDWVMDREQSIIISTGPDHRCWKQGVKLVTEPVAVGTTGSSNVNKPCSALVGASFEPSTGEVTVKYDFLL